MDLERFEKHVAQACALIASLREENRRLRRETSGLRLRNGALENAGKTTQAKVIELLQACDRIS
jgi:hypothetical protein